MTCTLRWIDVHHLKPSRQKFADAIDAGEVAVAGHVVVAAEDSIDDDDDDDNDTADRTVTKGPGVVVKGGASAS
jgi:16S rRNA U516 pseudouridylate synthase RsuA-like enzyme